MESSSDVVVKGRVLTGYVVSAKSIKTVVVKVERKKLHPRYKKQMRWSKKYSCHDELGVAKEGDLVKIGESRPFSKTKRFRVLSVLGS